MPVYNFKCPNCGRTKDVSLTVNERDTTVVRCDADDCRLGGIRHAKMNRIPTAAKFEIKGFSERNGYSK